MAYQTYGQGRSEIKPNRATRAEVCLTCEVRQGTRPWGKVRLQDISHTGFRIEWRPGLFENQQLYIRIPGLELLVANLRWKHEGWIGCEFLTQLYAPTFDHIVRQSMLEG